MNPSASLAVLLTLGLTLSACGTNSSPGQNGAHFDPPSTEFATNLGINTPPPVTRDQAMAIAVEAVRSQTGGEALALGAGEEREDGELLYEVQVRSSSGPLEVEVRASDGAVVEIEAGD